MPLHALTINYEALFRVFCGTLFGIIIGAERQYRARNAGLRTNALVSMGATLFVLLSAQGFTQDVGSPDPTRVAAQIVSGIGFLGAGVIMRDGQNVRGINTAATLWCSAAVGSLAGAGLINIAAIGTAMILVVNIFLRSISRFLSKLPGSGSDHSTRYKITAQVNNKDEGVSRPILMKAIKSTHYYLHGLETTRSNDETTTYRVTLYTDERDDKDFMAAIMSLSANPYFLSVNWTMSEEEEHKQQSQTISSKFLHRKGSTSHL